jgi:hypothetical protein
MDGRRARLPVTLAQLALALLLLTSASAAWAHPRSLLEAEPPLELLSPPLAGAPATAPVLLAQPPAAPAIWLGLALTIALGILLVAPRRALVLALAVLLGVLAVESSVHSVHHLADRQAASQCVVASASAHVHGTAEPLTPDAVWIPTAIGALALLEVDRPGSRVVRPDEGRAPPAA